MRYVLVTLLFLVPLFASAASYQDLLLTLDPELPGPGDTITATINSYAYDLNSTQIVWYLDGTVVGTGRSATFSAPTHSAPVELTVIAGSHSITHTITPAQLDLLWEADTYVPSFYTGRALPSVGSHIHAHAIPHIAATTLTAASTTANALLYNWYVNSRLLVDNSGVGRDVLITDAPGLYDSYLLSVEVLAPSGLKVARAGTRITSVEPTLVAYGVSPLLGTVTYRDYASLKDIALEDTPALLPYYFSIATPGELLYTKTRTGDLFTVKARHPSILLQSATATFTLRKGSETSATGGVRGTTTQPSIFGL